VTRGVTLATIRPALVWIHRWTGLLIAVFLVVEGLTGAIMAFEEPIGRWLNPSLFAPTSESGQLVLDLASLAIAAERAEPRAQVAYFSVSDNQALMRVVPRNDPATGKPYDIDFTHVVLDPHNGREIARLSATDHGPDRLSGVLPFIRDLHYTLKLGPTGAWIFFVVALAWTLDAFLSVGLTLPLTISRFWNRWVPSWRIKRGAGAYRVNFDLHRAGGLWFWFLAFIFAWSSVNLEDQVGLYDWVTSKLFDYVRTNELIEAMPHHADVPLKLDWAAAQRRGEKLMQERARDQGFRILGPAGLVHFVDAGLYNYSVHTDRSFPQPRDEIVFFDGDTGAPVNLPGETDFHFGNRVTDWFRALHMVGEPFAFLTYRWLVFVFGLLLAMLSVTGIAIWLRKHRARIRARRPAEAMSTPISE
jgi:uncharacterized iron-regulated membrane protein